SDDAAGGKRRRALGRGDDGGGSLAGARLFANCGDVDGAIGSDSQRSDFALGGFIEDEALGFRRGRVLARGLRGTLGDAQNAAAGFRASKEISLGVKSQNANVRFIARVEEFALAIGSDGEDLAFVTGSDIESSVG